MKRITTSFLFISFLLLNAVTSAQQSNSPDIDKNLLTLVTTNLKKAAVQYRLLIKNVPAEKFPKTFFAGNDRYEFSNSGWWCSGFYPGTLIMLYEETGDTALLAAAKQKLASLEKEQFNQSTHDLGFMMNNSFGNLYRLQPTPAVRDILINSARSLATRFSPVTGCIRSWDSADSTDFLVIIDNMMNLELLFRVTALTGDSTLYSIAVTHANSTLKNHFRSNYSSWHVVDYNSFNGSIIKKVTAQGYADSSAWARGQAWGLYGFTEVYRETKDKKYLQQATHIADFILNNPTMPADGIPYWDFNAPGIPAALRDASAAAILASALLELCRYVDAAAGERYVKTAEKILYTLSTPTYLAAAGTNGGFLLKHGVGHYPNQTEVDVPLTYADYYFVEAMKRYKAMAK